MKAIKITNKLQDICHNGHALKDIKLIINGVEINVYDVGICIENNDIKLVIDT